MTLWQLYLTFFRYGLLCFGGGYMMIPLITGELVGEPPLPMTAAEFGNLLSIAQMTPGPIGINTATYTGFVTHGIGGAAVGTLGLVTPALFLVIGACKLLKKYEDSVWVQGFLRGMRPAAFGLLFSAVVIFLELAVCQMPLAQAAAMHAWPGIRWGAVTVTVVSAVLLYRKKAHFLVLVILSALFGALFITT